MKKINLNELTIGLAEISYPSLTFDLESTEPKYSLSSSAKQLRKA